MPGHRHLTALAVLSIAAVGALTAGAPVDRPPHAPPAIGCGDSMPAWLRDHMRQLAQGTGRWIASNHRYMSDDEPFEEYGIAWRWGIGRQSLIGRLFGVRQGREAGDFWEFRLVWHPRDCEAVLYQFGFNGTIGIGPMVPDDSLGTVLEQTFYAVDGSETRVRHESRIQGNREYGNSFDWVDGEWQPRRSYVWERQR